MKTKRQVSTPLMITHAGKCANIQGTFSKGAQSIDQVVAVTSNLISEFAFYFKNSFWNMKLTIESAVSFLLKYDMFSKNASHKQPTMPSQ